MLLHNTVAYTPWLMILPTPREHTLPRASPNTKNQAASVPATSFSSSEMLGLSAGVEAYIMQRVEIALMSAQVKPLLLPIRETKCEQNQEVHNIGELECPHLVACARVAVEEEWDKNDA